MSKLGNYINESYRELVDKVSWPTWPQLQQTTMIVLGATIFITAVVGIMDFVITGKFGILTFLYKTLGG
jgi:preprotein translocase subunit SecE